MAQEATRRQSPVGHVVSTQVSEFKSNSCVPPSSEFLDMDDLGLERRIGKKALVKLL